METKELLYKSKLSQRQTEKAIELIKDFFSKNLAASLRLRRVTAPVIVQAGLGINDDLNGIEKPVSFSAKSLNGERVEIVQSLAKWKRLTLHTLKIETGTGIYTDMNALRPDEITDATHSIYVDQWDWEKRLQPEQRNVETLRDTVRKIYQEIRKTEYMISEEFHGIEPILPEDIKFFHSEDLALLYPTLAPKQREKEICKKYGAVFIEGIGYPLVDGKPHDGRAPDYDDWSTLRVDGKRGLNGDIMVWNPILNDAFELSSMGIRVNPKSMITQLDMLDCSQRKELWFHQQLINGVFPDSIGGGIGQSRLCMLLLRKAHIGEVQAAVWPKEMIDDCKTKGISLF
ncbi:MAG: aspartate--ammonia ligase [Bacteroidales bacterium]|nr:MAG: aspartate--ammonia ligase [Bacteroidales bacterium]